LNRTREQKEEKENKQTLIKLTQSAKQRIMPIKGQFIDTRYVSSTGDVSSLVPGVQKIKFNPMASRCTRTEIYRLFQRDSKSQTKLFQKLSRQLENGTCPVVSGLTMYDLYLCFNAILQTAVTDTGSISESEESTSSSNRDRFNQSAVPWTVPLMTFEVILRVLCLDYVFIGFYSFPAFCMVVYSLILQGQGGDLNTAFDHKQIERLSRYTRYLYSLKNLHNTLYNMYDFFDHIIPGTSEGFNGPEDVDNIVSYMYHHQQKDDVIRFEKFIMPRGKVLSPFRKSDWPEEPLEENVFDDHPIYKFPLTVADAESDISLRGYGKITDNSPQTQFEQQILNAFKLRGITDEYIVVFENIIRRFNTQWDIYKTGLSLGPGDKIRDKFASERDELIDQYTKSMKLAKFDFFSMFPPGTISKGNFNMVVALANVRAQRPLAILESKASASASALPSTPQLSLTQTQAQSEEKEKEQEKEQENEQEKYTREMKREFDRLQLENEQEEKKIESTTFGPFPNINEDVMLYEMYERAVVSKTFTISSRLPVSLDSSDPYEFTRFPKQTNEMKRWILTIEGFKSLFSSFEDQSVRIKGTKVPF